MKCVIRNAPGDTNTHSFGSVRVAGIHRSVEDFKKVMLGLMQLAMFRRPAVNGR
jgi:hypothetical protein